MARRTRAGPVRCSSSRQRFPRSTDAHPLHRLWRGWGTSFAHLSDTGSQRLQGTKHAYIRRSPSLIGLPWKSVVTPAPSFAITPLPSWPINAPTRRQRNPYHVTAPSVEVGATDAGLSYLKQYRPWFRVWDLVVLDNERLRVFFDDNYATFQNHSLIPAFPCVECDDRPASGG